MKYINFLLISFFLVFGNRGYAQLDFPSKPPFNQEKIENFEKLKKEFQKNAKETQKILADTDEYIATLSAEEQDKFNKAVKRLDEVVNIVSKKELSELIGKEFDEEFLKELLEKEIVEVEEEKIPTPKPVVTKQAKKNLAEAISLIDIIITYTNSFILKIASSPDLSKMIEDWGKKGIIREWPTTFNWTSFKLQLENLRKNLYKIKDKDPQTKKYKYAGDLIKDKVLYNNLAQLKTQITKYEPNIEIPEFGLAKLSAESKQATQKVANAYTEALYILKIPQALEKLFKKYEPSKTVKADKLRPTVTEKPDEIKLPKKKNPASGKTFQQKKENQKDLKLNYK